MKVEFHNEQMTSATVWRGIWWWKECADVHLDVNPITSNRWFYTNAGPSVICEPSMQDMLNHTRQEEQDRRVREKREAARESVWRKPARLPSARVVTLNAPPPPDDGWGL